MQRFFLCHQKLAAGGVARLLKMRLQKRSSRNSTFVDSDDLNDLTRLFSYDTETFVVLCSPDVLLRKWCIGEICTARAHDVHTVLVKWPEYVDPDEFFISNMESIIPGVKDLANYNISMDDVRESLRFIQTADSMILPASLCQDSIKDVCDLLVRSKVSKPDQHALGVRSSVATTSTKFGSETEREPISPDCPILAEPGNIEAEAAAFILMDLLIPRMNKAERCSLPTEGADLPATTMTALLICTEGCFKCPQIARWILQLGESPSWSLVPIIAEDRFLVPSAGFFEDLHSPSSKLQLKVNTRRYALHIKAVFQEISTVFVPQMYSSTQEDLELRAKQVAGRLQSDSLKPLSVKVRACEEKADALESAKEGNGLDGDAQAFHEGSTDAGANTPEKDAAAFDDGDIGLDLPPEALGRLRASALLTR
eukprot:s3133_g3.t1